MLLQGIHEHPVRRHPIHVDFYVVKMTEELSVDVPIDFVGNSHAADKLGGTLLHIREHVSVRALPADLPHALELDISPLVDFDAVLHVRDLVVPDWRDGPHRPDEPLARVQPPRVEEEFAPVVLEAPAAAAPEAGEAGGAGSAEDAS